MSIAQKVKGFRDALRRRIVSGGGLQIYTPGIADHLPSEQRYTLEEIAEMQTEAQRVAGNEPIRWRETKDGSIEFYSTLFIYTSAPKQAAKATHQIPGSP